MPVRRVLAWFPDLTAHPWVQALRLQHDPLAQVLAPHVTVLHPFETAASLDEVQQHLRGVLDLIKPFQVRLQGITAHHDHLFLNVKQGNDAFIALRDGVASGVLQGVLDPRFTYVPHLTLGKMPLDHLERLLPSVVEEQRSIHLTVQGLRLYRIQDGKRETEADFLLGGSLASNEKLSMSQ